MNDGLYKYTTTAEITTTTAHLAAVASNIPVVDASKLSAPPNHATLFDPPQSITESVHYTGISGNTLTGVTRGRSFSTARSWPPGTSIANDLTPDDINSIIDNIRQAKLQISEIKVLIDNLIDNMPNLDAINTRLATLENLVFPAIPAQFVALQNTINALDVRVTSLELGNIGGSPGDLAALTGRVTALETALAALDVDALKDAIDEINDLLDDLPPDWNFLRATDLVPLQTAMTAVQGRVTDIEDRLDDFLVAADLIPITNRLTTVENILTLEVWD